MQYKEIKSIRLPGKLMYPEANLSRHSIAATRVFPTLAADGAGILQWSSVQAKTCWNCRSLKGRPADQLALKATKL